MIKNINPADLIPLDMFEANEPVTIDLVYATANHSRNIFQEALYHSNARMWAHGDIAALTILVSRKLNSQHGWLLKLKDCLRTCDAQAAMGNTKIVKDHPEWSQEGPDRMISPPGLGAHPRAMAIDIQPIYEDGNSVDMGTPFDDMSEKSARNYKNFPQSILNNREILQSTFIKTAQDLNFPLYMVQSEWWDYRHPGDIYNQFAPLRDADLPSQMQMTQQVENGIDDFNDAHFQKLKDDILRKISDL